MSKRSRNALLIIGGAVICLMIILVFTGNQYLHRLAPRARQRVIAALSDRFDADVQLKSLDLTLMPAPRVIGEGLEIWRRHHPGKQPFLKVSRFTASAHLNDVLYQRDRVEQLNLEGLQIDIPRRQDEVEPKEERPVKPNNRGSTLRVLIDTLIADGAVLQIEPKSPDKDPLRFEIPKLTMHSIGADSPLTFVTLLHNARPPGLIDSTGSFGPWQRDDLRATPIKGNYRLINANLGVFAGINGTLSSTGSYNGQLDKIGVDGTTDVPDFALKRGGSPVHLTTEFHAFVDGTNGDTLLQPVKAHFLHSDFICEGGVEEKHPHNGKTVALQTRTTNARIEDILLLISGVRKPLLNGPVQFQSSILIPPGKQDVLNKLVLHGRFNLESGIFTNPRVEHRLETLSDRAQGITKKEEQKHPPPFAASNLSATFSLEDGVARFSQILFQVPGAAIRIAGDYNLQNERVDMSGVFRMQAKLAQTQSGFKHWLLVPLNPVFEKGGAGFQVPLSITGTRDEPQIEVRALHHRFKLK